MTLRMWREQAKLSQHDVGVKLLVDQSTVYMEDDVRMTVEKLLEGDRLTQNICQQLAWLYVIRNGMQAKQITPTTNNATVATTRQVEAMTPDIAETWVSCMDNADGTTGGHWTIEQARNVQAQRNIPGEPSAFYAILNSCYSDYCLVARKYGVDNVNFFADLASAWLNDSDANKGKAMIYYSDIVKKRK